jgi:hypothetical protein
MGLKRGYQSTNYKMEGGRRMFRRTFHLAFAAQHGQLYSRAITLIDSYESGGNCIQSCSAGVSPAHSRCMEGGKIAGETPALQKLRTQLYR